MATKTLIPDHVIEQAKSADLVQLVGNGIELRKASGNEYEGPCPKCGGTDRFHVRPDGWFCRHCKPIDDAFGWHGAIDYVMWAENVAFPEAVRRITGHSVTLRNSGKREAQPERKPVIEEPQDERWVQGAQRILNEAQAAIAKDDSPGADYLLSRAIEPATWQHFGAGYGMHKSAKMQHAAPAIALPWYGKYGLHALRFRFLNPTHERIVSRGGSKFRGIVFGRNALQYWDKNITGNNLTLVLCEGELNAMSIWQAQHEAGIEVLSVGSESAQVPDGVIQYANQFRHVLIWMDKPEIARKVMAEIPGSHSLSSPKGRDANDLLQSGWLGKFLTMARIRMCQSDADKELLYWLLWDAMRNPNSYDAETKILMERIQP